MNRRKFLAATSATLVASQTLAAGDRKRRVAVIGHTGRGNYGHGLDVVWQKIPHAEIVGVADADEKGLDRARSRLTAWRGTAWKSPSTVHTFGCLPLCRIEPQIAQTFADSVPR